MTETTQTTRAERVKATLATLETGALTLAQSDDDDASDDDDRRVVTFFKVVHVFDLAQTEGESLPAIANKLAGIAPAGAYNVLAAVASAERLSVEYADLGLDCNGSYSRDARRIQIATGRSEAQRVKTLAHELAHHFTETDCSRPEAEIIAESVAYVVSDALGLDTSRYSFGYVAHWAGGDAAPIRATIKDVQTVAHRLLDALETAAAKSDGATATPEPTPAPVAAAAPTPSAPAVPAAIAKLAANDPQHVVVIDYSTPDPAPAPAPAMVPAPLAPLAPVAPLIPAAVAVAIAPAPEPEPARTEESSGAPIVCDHDGDNTLAKHCDPWRCDRCGGVMHAHKDHASRLRAEHEKACKSRAARGLRPYKGPGRNKAIADALEPAEGLIRVLEYTWQGQGYHAPDGIVGVTAHWGSDAARAAGHALLASLGAWQGVGAAGVLERAEQAGLTVERTTDHRGKAISKTGGEFRRHEYRVKVA